MGAYVTYLRLSRESKNGQNYGLAAQRQDVDMFLGRQCPDVDGCVELAEYREVQSGAKDDRPKLAEAIAHCRREGATLLVAKLDRLSRRVSFIAQLLEQSEREGWSFKVAAMPRADKFQLHIYAALAEQEREFISARTKAGLARAKARGVQLGGTRPATARRAEEAQKRAEELRSLIAPMRERGDSMQTIAKALNAAGIPSPSQKKGVEWSVMAVKRTMQRAGIG